MRTRGKRFTRMTGVSYVGLVYTDAGGVSIRIFDKDSGGNILRCSGTTVPIIGTAGYAKGALFTDTDVAASYAGIWINIGTTLACNFALIGAASTSSSSSSSSSISTSSSSLSTSSTSSSSSSVSTSSSSSSAT